MGIGAPRRCRVEMRGRARVSFHAASNCRFLRVRLGRVGLGLVAHGLALWSRFYSCFDLRWLLAWLRKQGCEWWPDGVKRYVARAVSCARRRVATQRFLKVRAPPQGAFASVLQDASNDSGRGRGLRPLVLAP